MPKSQEAELRKEVSRERILLVEFKAPEKLVAAFDLKLRSQYSSRSEAIRSLMRAFLSESLERS